MLIFDSDIMNKQSFSPLMHNQYHEISWTYTHAYIYIDSYFVYVAT